MAVLPFSQQSISSTVLQPFVLWSSSTTQALCVCGISAVCCSAQLTTATTGFFSGAPCHNSVDLTLYGNKVFDNGFVGIYSLQILNSFCLFMLCCGALRYSHQNSVSDAKPNRVNRSERSEPNFSGLRRARHFCGLNLFLHEIVFFQRVIRFQDGEGLQQLHVQKILPSLFEGQSKASLAGPEKTRK